MKKLLLVLSVAIFGLLLNSCTNSKVKDSPVSPPLATTVESETTPNIGKCLAAGASVASSNKVQSDSDADVYESLIKVTPIGEDSIQAKSFSFVKRIDLQQPSGGYQTYYLVCPKLVWTIGVLSTGQQDVLYTTRVSVTPLAIKNDLKAEGFELASAQVLKQAPIDIATYIPDVYSKMRGSFSVWGDGASKDYGTSYQEPRYNTWTSLYEKDSIMLTDDVFLVRKI